MMKNPHPRPADEVAELREQEADLIRPVMRMYGEMSDAVAAGTEDCDALGASLDAIVTRHKAALKRMAAHQGGLEAPGKQRFESVLKSQHGQEVVRARESVQRALRECSADSAVGRALFRLAELQS